MRHPLCGKTALVGMGTAGIGAAPGFSAMELLGLSVRAALDDAGMRVSDIDAVFAATNIHPCASMSVSEYLGLKPRYFDATNIGGSSFELHLLQATLALQAGLCNAALICYGSNQLTAGGRLAFMSDPQWHETSYDARGPITGYALAANRHMHQFGTTREMLADVAVSARQWANLNPQAFARGPLTRDSVLSMRMISDPLTIGDCCLVTDGAAACIMVRSERARDFRKVPVYFLGGAAANWHRSIQSMPDITVTAAKESGPRAFTMAGLSHSDVDLVMLYDAFTINTILFLEDLGFCPKGEGGRFVQDGRIAPGGSLAVNTNGGGLSCVHPGMYGMFLIAESVAQIRREAGERQVKNVDIALLHGNGGTLSSQVTAFLGSEAAL
ncbi:acetyl-CoA acetyltransferase [Bradyrhizobium sp. USDA 3311]